MTEIEVFTASCPLCKEAMEIIKRVGYGKCTVTEYNLFERCEDKVCLEKAKEYGIRAVPTMVVDGKVAVQGRPTERQVRHYLGL
ncbi:MAG: thioredoxin family protein [Thermoplasmata archaeon]|nr:thioredoxin family protein [Candidatus Thermoplasmatota archaeon]MCK4949500.1 thioredoxin family protein [Thermoplasmata archaeon]